MKLDLGAALKFGWQVAKSNVLFFLGVLATLGLVEFVPSAVANSLKSSSPGLSVVINVLGIIASLILSVGVTKISLKFADSIKPVFQDLYQGYSTKIMVRYFLAAVLSSLFSALAAMPGAVLLAVLLVTKSPGLSLTFGILLMLIGALYMGLRLGQCKFPIVDRGAGVLESLKYSWKITENHVSQLLLFTVELAGIVIIGVLIFGVGLLWAIPTVMVASAYIFRQLEKIHNASFSASPLIASNTPLTPTT
jgi:uncharacterized membrane protein